MINPLHAVAPVEPHESSPYYPTSRRYRNPIYLRVEDVPGTSAIAADLQPLGNAGRALNSNRLIDRDAVWRLKRQALERIFAQFTGDDRFEQFQHDHSETLLECAAFCTLAEEFGRDYRLWPNQYRHPASPAVAEYRGRQAGRIRFHSWLQWLLELQLADAARELNIMKDLAVGFDPGGTDAWVWQDLLARDMSLGATRICTILGDNAGACRRSFRTSSSRPGTTRSSRRFAWVLRPPMDCELITRSDCFACFGYRAAAMPRKGPTCDIQQRICSTSSHWRPIARAHSSLPRTLAPLKNRRAALMDHQMLSYRLLWLEKECPHEFPVRSMAAVTTHDLFTVAGLWTMSDHASQERIGLKPDRRTTYAVKERVMQQTGLAADAALDEVSLTVHRLLAEAPSLVITATLDDAILVEERPNMPGTIDQWPNWRMALPQPIEDIEGRELPRQIADVLSRREPFTSDGGTCGGDGE